MRRLMSRIPAAAVANNRVKERESDAPESLYAAPKRNDARANRKRFQLPVSEEGDEIAQRSAGTVIRANNDSRSRIRENSGGQQPDGRILTNSATDPMVASVRIRVRDAQGINYGSGTVIDSRAGRSLVLTCGHIFRGVPKNATIEVDRFEGKKAIAHRGTIITYDLKADVGLMSIETDKPVPTARLAPADGGPRRGDSLVGIGCGGGRLPLKIAVRVTGVNVYLGPGNLECTGMPQQGRSGGGLFDQSGRLVGVCFAAEPRNRRGLYASLQPIHSLLKKVGLQIRESKAESATTRLAGGTSQGPSENAGMASRFSAAADRLGSFADASAETEGAENPGESPRRDVIRIDQRQLALMQVPLQRDNRQPAADESKSGPFPSTASDGSDGSTGAEPRRESPESPLKQVDDVLGKSGEAEVVCVIRRLDDPRAPSKVVIINRASAKFVRFLQNETRQQPRKTARFVGILANSATTAARNSAHESRPPRETLTSHFHTVGSEPGRYRRSRTTRLP
jgi:hypothetical protein